VDGLGTVALTQLQYILGNFVQPVGSTVLVSTASSISFSSIPSTRSLLLKWRCRATDAVVAEPLLLQINGDTTTTNYVSMNNQYNNTTGPASVPTQIYHGLQIATIAGASATSLYFSSGYCLIDGIIDTTNYVSATGNGGAFASTSNAWTGTYTGIHLSPGPVNILTILGSSGNLAAGTAMAVYMLA
jgi:hypothetical protein